MQVNQALDVRVGMCARDCICLCCVVVVLSVVACVGATKAIFAFYIKVSV